MGWRYSPDQPPSSRMIAWRASIGPEYLRWAGWADWTISLVRIKSRGEKMTEVRVWDSVERNRSGPGVGE